MLIYTWSTKDFALALKRMSQSCWQNFDNAGGDTEACHNWKQLVVPASLKPPTATKNELRAMLEVGFRRFLSSALAFKNLVMRA
jgi:hypothetical protein